MSLGLLGLDCFCLSLFVLFCFPLFSPPVCVCVCCGSARVLLGYWSMCVLVSCFVCVILSLFLCVVGFFAFAFFVCVKGVFVCACVCVVWLIQFHLTAWLVGSLFD